MEQDFAGREGVALVTGGSGAIGAATMKMLAARGSKVVFTYLSNEEAAAELDGRSARAGVGDGGSAARPEGRSRNGRPAHRARGAVRRHSLASSTPPARSSSSTI